MFAVSMWIDIVTTYLETREGCKAASAINKFILHSVIAAHRKLGLHQLRCIRHCIAP